MPLIRDVVLPTLEELELSYLVDPKRAERVVLPMPLEGNALGFALVLITTSDEAREVRIEVGICHVPQHRQEQVLRVLNDLNGKLEYRFVKWLLLDELVVASSQVELAYAGDRKKAFRFALLTILDAHKEEWQRLVRAASKRGRRSRLDQELTSILDRLQVEQ